MQLGMGGTAAAPRSRQCPCRDPRAVAVPQVNGLDTVRVPMAVVQFMRPKTKRYKQWLAQHQARLAAHREELL